MATDPHQVHLRLGDEVSKQVDRYIAFMKEATGVELSRTDATLSLVRRGISSWLEGLPESMKKQATEKKGDKK